MLRNFSAVINHCGNISRKFSIGRGARQGDPIASYLFREELNVGTVPTFKMHNIGTVPTFKMHNVGTVPMFKMHNVGTPKMYYF